MLDLRFKRIKLYFKTESELAELLAECLQEKTITAATDKLFNILPGHMPDGTKVTRYNIERIIKLNWR